jgi:sugar lactone lactonase YvrE
MDVSLVYQTPSILGEGPAWDARTQTLYWVDIINKLLHVHHPADSSNQTLELEDMVGCIAPCRSGGLVMALRDRFAQLDLASAKTTPITAPEGEPSNTRFNDGKCDPAGRFLAGTMALKNAESVALGSFYSLEPDGQVTRLLSDVHISNGLAWSPDYKTFYYIDTPTHRVRAFDYDLKSGQIANGRVVVQVPKEMGWPDGMTSDTEGKLWIAIWQGAQVTRWDPQTGELLQSFPVPAKNVSSCAFGGPDLTDLYITSARQDLDDATLQAYPLTGSLFRLQTGIRGMPTFEFAR